MQEYQKLWENSPRIQQNWFHIFLICLRFSTQFTRIMEITSLFELPFCREALGKNLSLAMWSLGRGQRRSGGKSGWGSPESGRRRVGEGPTGH
jgi:hypothetical protein